MGFFIKSLLEALCKNRARKMASDHPSRYKRVSRRPPTYKHCKKLSQKDRVEGLCLGEEQDRSRSLVCIRMQTIDQCASAGSCRGSELNSTRALILMCNSTAVSSAVHSCIYYKLFVCESKPAFIYSNIFWLRSDGTKTLILCAT